MLQRNLEMNLRVRTRVPRQRHELNLKKFHAVMNLVARALHQCRALQWEKNKFQPVTQKCGWWLKANC